MRGKLSLFVAGISLFCGVVVTRADDQFSVDPLVVGQLAPDDLNAPEDSSEPLSDQPIFEDNLITGPATAPVAATQPTLVSQSAVERSVTEFIGHFSGYQPMYIVGGWTSPVVKFQFSFKYRLFNPDAPLAKAVPLLGRLHFSYTQLSLWELDQSSAPFYDSNYQPEFFYSNEDIKLIHLPGVSQLGLQGGFWHCSNGEGGATSRSENMLFIRPILTFGDPEKFHFTVAPRFYTYVGDLSNNPNIYHYQGYCDFRAVLGWRQGLELAFQGRIGSHWDRGSTQFDLTYPLRDILAGNLDLYLDVQYFNGYGESLLSYDRRTQELRIGLALVR